MAKAGRPTKLTPGLQATLVEFIDAGNYRCVAAQAVGVGERTLRDWMKRGEDEPDSIYADFRREVLEAEAAAERRMVAIVVMAAAEDPKHAQWYLERKFHQRWGRKDKYEHTGEAGGPVQIAVVPVHGEGDPMNGAGEDDTDGGSDS